MQPDSSDSEGTGKRQNYTRKQTRRNEYNTRKQDQPSSGPADDPLDWKGVQQRKRGKQTQTVHYMQPTSLVELLTEQNAFQAQSTMEGNTKPLREKEVVQDLSDIDDSALQGDAQPLPKEQQSRLKQKKKNTQKNSTIESKRSY